MSRAVKAKKRGSSQRLDWRALVAHAATIVESYDTPVTLRQLFYRMVAAWLLPNTRYAYSKLSERTTDARRLGEFPDLLDRTRRIHRDLSFSSPKEARKFTRQIYRRDRTEGQAVSVYLAVEKAGMVEQLHQWFGDLGLPILATGGYASQTYVGQVIADVKSAARPAVVLYAGDFDASGEDIFRNFVDRTRCWDQVRLVALTPQQVDAYQLPPQQGKTTDSRARAFQKKYGRLIQVELDALPPDVLRELFAAAISEFWDPAAHSRVMDREQAERDTLWRRRD